VREGIYRLIPKTKSKARSGIHSRGPR